MDKKPKTYTLIDNNYWGNTYQCKIYNSFDNNLIFVTTNMTKQDVINMVLTRDYLSNGQLVNNFETIRWDYKNPINKIECYVYLEVIQGESR